MLIVLDKSLCTIDDTQIESLHICLRNLRDAYFNRYHIVQIDDPSLRELLDILKDGPLLDFITILISNLTNRINPSQLSHVAYVKNIKRDEVHRIVNNGTTKIELSYLNFRNPTSSRETNLLCEFKEDGDFYKSVVNYYRKANNLAHLFFKFSSLNGGGSSICKIYKTRDEKDRFCLCISDSDKKTPHDEIGPTARCIKQIPENEIHIMSHLQVNENFQEIENLFPLSLLHDFSSEDNLKRTFNLLKLLDDQKHAAISFFDLKEGLYLSSIKSCTILEYWENVLRTLKYEVDIPNKKKLEKNKTNPLLPQRFHYKGKKLFFAGYQPKKDKQKKLDQIKLKLIKGIDQSTIDTFNVKNYDELGKLIFSWSLSNYEVV
ncbi:MAG TPA: hypothetical protein PLE74_04885 [Candidatus Cloacimonadota bacterium]|nr:hypothetical protein [Candidatus Cloacimonadota bacterium]